MEDIVHSREGHVNWFFSAKLSVMKNIHTNNIIKLNRLYLRIHTHIYVCVNEYILYKFIQEKLVKKTSYEFEGDQGKKNGRV